MQIASRDCRNISDSNGSFLCSACGAHIYKPNISRSYVDDDGNRWYTTDMRGIGMHYCINCGRKIIAEERQVRNERWSL